MTTTKNSVSVPQGAWHDERDVELHFPEEWKVTICAMEGHDAPGLDESGFRKAFANPIGSRTIKEMAQDKRNVVILFDDMSRPTKTFEIVPFVLEELAAAGVEENNIQFICALGSHGALTAHDFAKKLRKNVPGRFKI